MPWKRTAVSEQRVQFVVRAVSGQETMAGLCRAFGISRPTGYLWRERYRPSPRAYQAQPQEWDYPAGSVVKRLNSQGSLEGNGERCFVWEALAGRPVRVEVLEELFLVSYQHMYIREIDSVAGRSRPLVLERQSS